MNNQAPRPNPARQGHSGGDCNVSVGRARYKHQTILNHQIPIPKSHRL